MAQVSTTYPGVTYHSPPLGTPLENYTDLLTLRYHKVRLMLSLAKRHTRSHWLRYEDLRAAPEPTLRTMGSNLSLTLVNPGTGRLVPLPNRVFRESVYACAKDSGGGVCQHDSPHNRPFERFPVVRVAALSLVQQAHGVQVATTTTTL